MENVKSEDLATFDWLLKFGVQKFIFERLYDPKGSKEISIDFGQDKHYYIRIGSGKDAKLFYNKDTYILEPFGNGLLHLREIANYDNALIMDKQGNVVYGFDNYNLFERFDLPIPIKTIWEARNSRIKYDDFFHNYMVSQGYEFHVDNH